MTVGDRIRLRRIELGMSQEELAKRMGFKTRSAISNIEKRPSDKMYRKTVEKYAEVLKCSPESLIGWSDDNNLDINETDLVADIIQDSGMIRLVKLFSSLNEEHQSAILEQIEFYIDKENKGK